MATSHFPLLFHRLAVLAQADFAQYRVRDLTALTGLSSVSVRSLNERGDFTVVDNRSRHSFAWVGGQLHDLGFWIGGDVVVNARGEVAGTRQGADGNLTPYIWRDGTFTDLSSVLGSNNVDANGINASGAVTGRADGLAYVWDGSRVRRIDVPGARISVGFDINDRGEVVGSAFFPGDGDALTERAFTAAPDGSVTVLPAPVDFASRGAYSFTAVNDRGNGVVRWSDYELDAIGSSLWIGGRHVPLGSDRLVADINNRDLAVGMDVYELNVDEITRVPTLYRAEGSRELRDQVIGPGADQWLLQTADAVNDRGQVIGVGIKLDAGQSLYLATPVPEPGSVALLLAGMGVVGVVAARRRRADDGTAD